MLHQALLPTNSKKSNTKYAAVLIGTYGVEQAM